MTTAMTATSSPPLASYQNLTFNAFYICFQNGTSITQEMMVPDPNTGVAVLGAPGAQIALSEAIARPGLGSAGVIIGFCFGVMLLSLL